MNHSVQTHPHRWLAFGAVVAASFMDLLDAMVANVAGPSIRGDLGGSYATLQWLTAGYTLAMAVMLLTGGRLGDMFGRRRMLLTGMAGFTAASLLCAVAQSPEMLIASRVLQGACGAVMLPQGFGLIRDLFPPAEMGKAWAVFGPVMGFSAVIGPVIAGTLLDWNPLDLGWRSIFLVNVPIGAVALVIGFRHLPAVEPSARGTRLDLTSVAIAAAGMGMLVYPLVQGREQGWPAWSLALLAGAVPVLALLGRRQVVRKRAGRAPLVEPRVFSRASYVNGLTFGVVFCSAMGGLSLVLAVVLQIGLGYAPMHATLMTVWWPAGAFVGSALAHMLSQKLGRGVLQLGLVGMLAGVVGLALVFAQADGEVTALSLVAPNLVGGIGMGMIFVPLFDLVIGGVAPEEMGSASSVFQATQQLGMSLGVAIAGTVLFGQLGSTPDRAADFLHAGEVTCLVSAGLVALALALVTRLPRQARIGGGAPEPAAA
jgi:EmrB/QacA subfamily drug resistance transporter